MSATSAVRAFFERIVRETGASHDALVRELQAEATAAVRAYEDVEVDYVVRLDPEALELEVRQRFRVVDTVESPWREITAKTLHDHALLFRKDAPDFASLPIVYTHHPEETARARELDSVLGEIVASSRIRTDLWPVLDDAVARMVARHLPRRAPTPGTVGHALASQGWPVGRRAANAGTTIEVRATILEERWDSSAYEPVLTLGFELLLDREVLRIVDDSFSTRELRASWCDLPSAPSPLFDEALAQITANTDSAAAAQQLLSAMVEQPSPESLFAYLATACARNVPTRVVRLPAPSGLLTLRYTEAFPPAADLYFGEGRIGLVVALGEREVATSAFLGMLTPRALRLPAPTDAEGRAYIARLFELFAEYHEAFARFLLEENPVRSADDFAYHLQQIQFHPLSLAEAYVALGPPGPPAVPRWDEEAKNRAGKLVRPHPRIVSEETAQCIAAFDIAGYVVSLWDDPRERPFRLPDIRLRPREGDEHFRVFMCDAWNPEARRTIDADAFAFRRFVTWLAEGIARAGLDEEVVFGGESDSETPKRSIRLTEWLRFGEPDFGDRFLVDHRVQWNLVPTEQTLEVFAGIYGFSAETRAAIRSQCKVWRQFLREVVDPRFAQTERPDA